uniref:Uncharacterized protein n=1 Tax=Panagrolaimus davidi TaxID=227884 RepID=A0A914PJV7_9BILA
MGAKIVCLNPTPKLTFPPSDGFDIEMKIYDITTLEGNIRRLTSINKPKDVLKKIAEINVKVVLYYFTFDDGEKAEIAKLLKSYYQKRDITFFCCSSDSIYYSSLLLAYVKEYGENVIEDSQTLLIIYDDRKYFKEISARSIEIKKTNDYFYFDDIEFIEDYTLEYSDEKFKKKFIKTSTVFVYFEECISGPNAHQKHTFDLIAAKIKDKTIRIINEDIMYFENDAITSKVLKYIGKKPFKYDFATISYRKFILGAFEPWMKTSQDQNFYKNCLISVNPFEILPLKKTIVFYETFEKIVVC